MLLHANHSRGLRNKLVEKGSTLLEENKAINLGTFTKELNTMIKQEDYQWLRDVSKSSLVAISRKLYYSYLEYFKGNSNKPKFRKKKDNNYYFYPRSDAKCKFYIDTNKNIQIEKLGRVKISRGSLKSYSYLLDRIQEKDRLRESLITYDGKYWYISIMYRDDLVFDKQVTELTNEVIGIDLGIKTLAFCSNGKSYKNITKTAYTKKIERRLYRLQRKLSRKYLMNRKGNEYIKTNNIIKLEKEVKVIYRKLNNISTNHIHNMTKEIVESKPREIVIEDLKVENMKKNKFLAKSIDKCRFYMIREQLEYKCKDRGILLTVANRWYPSSQLCYDCGKRKMKKDKLDLSQRFYSCECGNNKDRDFNASLNLKEYRNSEWYQENIITI